MKKVYIVVPKKLSSNIFSAQIIPIVTHLEFLGYEVSYGCASSLKLVKNQIDIVYTRDIFDFVNVFFFYKVNHIFHDFRAIVSDESFYKHNKIIRKFFLRIIELFVFYNADQVFCVSNNLKKRLVELFFQRNIFVIPCCYDQCHRIEKIYNHNILYLGSLSKWQNVEKILNLVVVNNLEKNFTIISNQVTAAKEIATRNNIDVPIYTVTRDHLFQELEQFSFGFIIRDCSIVNEVSCPIKFLEYLANGIVPIVSGKIGDFTEHYLFEKVCIFVDTLEDDLFIKLDSFNFQSFDLNRKLFLKDYNFSNFYNDPSNPWVCFNV